MPHPSWPTRIRGLLFLDYHSQNGHGLWDSRRHNPKGRHFLLGLNHRSGCHKPLCRHPDRSRFLCNPRRLMLRLTCCGHWSTQSQPANWEDEGAGRGEMSVPNVINRIGKPVRLLEHSFSYQGWTFHCLRQFRPTEFSLEANPYRLPPHLRAASKIKGWGLGYGAQLHPLREGNGQKKMAKRLPLWVPSFNSLTADSLCLMEGPALFDAQNRVYWAEYNAVLCTELSINKH